MSDLIVFTYNESGKALEVLQKVVELQKQHLIQVEDAAVVVKNDKGKVKIRQTLESAMKGEGVFTGGFWGLLIGFIFGGPIFGALLGMGLGAIFGSSLDIGVDNNFIKDVGNDLAPGDSALFLLIREATIDRVTDALKPFGGTLYHTSLSKEAEESFAKAMEHEPLAKAVEETHREE